jgi:hypothetical protein
VKVSLHPEADDEFAEAVRYYSQISPALAVRFIARWNVCFARLPLIPNVFASLTRRHADISATIFPTQSFFLKPDCIWVIAVMHMKHKPGYWRERLT